MKIKWYTNACVRISSEKGTNILCDPWVNPGAFLGSWYHWPPIPEDLEESLLAEPCNGIYISHLHPDHYDPKFISKFVKLRPGIPIYIAQFAHGWLKRSLESIAKDFTQVIEVPTLIDVEIEDDLSFKIFAADTCNPLICGSNIPCQSEPSLRGIDSIAVFSADNAKIVNANDAMGVSLIPKIAANVGSADLIMGHYGGASPFPQCFPDVEDKISARNKVVETACKMLVSAATAINAKSVMPFAGQYVLAGNLVDLNNFRATIPLDQAVNYLKTLSDKEIVSVMPGGEINLLTKTKTPDYSEPNLEVTNKYFSKISKVRFPYQKDRTKEWVNPSADLLFAAEKVLTKSKSAKILIKNSFIIGDSNNKVTINLDPSHSESSVEYLGIPKFENVTEILIPTELLRNLTLRKRNYLGFTSMHWNQADVGSHFIWKRKGIFDLSSHMLLNFFGT